jgi:hypothetical protein
VINGLCGGLLSRGLEIKQIIKREKQMGDIMLNKINKTLDNKIKFARFTGLLFLMSAAQSFGMHQESRGCFDHEQKHAQVAGSVNQHVCPEPECGARLASKIGLAAHMKQHGGADVNPFLCQYCNVKRFPYKSTLLKHESSCQKSRAPRQKNGVIPPCSYCGKIFKKNSHLQEHLRMHTGERPYECDVCGSTFGWKISYTQHMKTHAKKRKHARIVATITLPPAQEQPVPQERDPALESGPVLVDGLPRELAGQVFRGVAGELIDDISGVAAGEVPRELVGPEIAQDRIAEWDQRIAQWPQTQQYGFPDLQYLYPELQQ